MDEKDYGDIRHKHTHIHTMPEPHLKILDTALKDWCMGVFDDEDKCEALNVNHYEEIMTIKSNLSPSSSTADVNLSTIYNELMKLQKLTGTATAPAPAPEKETYTIDGTQIVYTDITNKELRGEIMFDKVGGTLYSFINISGNKPEEIEITNTGFNDGTDIPYIPTQTNAKEKIKVELQKLDVEVLIEDNKKLMEDIKKLQDDIGKESIKTYDNVTPLRRLAKYEKQDYDVLSELYLVIFYLIIGIFFGIYCFYFFL